MKGIDSVLEHNDIAIVKKLKANKYANNSMGRDGEYIKAIRHKLRAIATQLFEKYNVEYGNFQIATSSGNPLSRGGVVNRPWATLYKGSDRKQYAAQITIGIDAVPPIPDIKIKKLKAIIKNKCDNFNTQVLF